jgi:integrase
MSKPLRIPKYSLHKHSGQARVTVRGKHVYLGKYGSAASHQKYAEIIAGLGDSSLNTVPDTSFGGFPELSVDEVILQYLLHAKSYYSFNGQPTKEYRCMLDAVKHLRARYGACAAAEFGPRKLALVREDMIEQELARTVINNRINRIRRVFKWSVSMELVPPAVYQGICSLEGLKFGRSKAKESKPVKPVSDVEIERTLTVATPQVRAMILLQRYTGMRPGEVVIMRPCDIDFNSSPWIYSPYTHKNRYRGHAREIPLGPKSQQLIAPFLPRAAGEYLFSPAESEKHRNQQRRQLRETPMTPSQARRKAKAKPKRPKRKRYDVESYRRAIRYCQIKLQRLQDTLSEDQKNPVEYWHPHQLRHQFATVVRKELGAEAVQIGLGHKSTDLVDLYAEKNLEAAKTIALRIG